MLVLRKRFYRIGEHENSHEDTCEGFVREIFVTVEHKSKEQNRQMKNRLAARWEIVRGNSARKGTWLNT